jgi:hypothetical protein
MKARAHLADPVTTIESVSRGGSCLATEATTGTMGGGSLHSNLPLIYRFKRFICKLSVDDVGFRYRDDFEFSSLRRKGLDPRRRR